MRSITIAFVLSMALAGSAEAVTLRELVELSRAGLSDDILIALVEADKSAFRLTAKEIQELKKEGLTEKVLLHLIQTPELRRLEGRASDPYAAVPQEAPAPVVVAAPVQRETVVVVDRVETVAVPVAVPVYVPVRDRPSKPREEEKPVYWGFNGKLRPGSWRDK